MVMEIMSALFVVVFIAAIFVWRRFSGHLNRILGVLLFGVLAYIIGVAIVAVAFRGVTSVEEIIAMLL